MRATNASYIRVCNKRVECNLFSAKFFRLIRTETPLFCLLVNTNNAESGFDPEKSLSPLLLMTRNVPAIEFFFPNLDNGNVNNANKDEKGLVIAIQAIQ